MQQKQKRGHHFVLKTDRSKIDNNKNLILSIKTFLPTCESNFINSCWWIKMYHATIWGFKYLQVSYAFFRSENCLVSPSHLRKQISEKIAFYWNVVAKTFQEPIVLSNRKVFFSLFTWFDLQTRAKTFPPASASETTTSTTRLIAVKLI